MGPVKLLLTAFLVFSVIIFDTFGAPADSLVVTSTEATSSKASVKENVSKEKPTVPEIYQMHVKAKISNRFAHTTVISKVKNAGDKSQEATFSVVLPESAFISGFIMEVDGKNYTAYVKEKEEAKKTYDQAVASGLGAAHVAVSARDSNRFTVSVNIQPETKAAFYLNYEELLKRDNGVYEVVVNLHPGQPVEDLEVEVFISESRKITKVKAPPLRSGNEIGNEKDELDPRADIVVVNETASIVRFVPNVERQKQLAHILGTEESKGLSGQFVVQYDVERDPTGGEVLIQDGYFAHFFAPTNLEPLPKHVVFVLDTSASMYGTRIQQLKEAMHKILEQLHPKDLFTLVEFNSNARVWNLYNSSANVWYPSSTDYWGPPTNEEVDISTLVFPKAYAANPDNIKKAKETVTEFVSDGGTDIHTALKVGLYLVEQEKIKKSDEVIRQAMIIFLTDGEPTVRITSTSEIENKISEYNSGERKAPIFALSFGDGADKKFLQKLALRNSGFSKHIYEGADASLQLQDFYRQVSSPLLSDVTFKYESTEPESLTKTVHPIMFGGGEIMVCGRIPFVPNQPGVIDPAFAPQVHGWNLRPLEFKPIINQHPITNVERVWAYLTIKQLLEEKEIADDKKEELKKKALDLALKYSFVTPLSSLVVVKPNDTSAVETEAADNKPLYALGMAGPPAPSLSLPPSYFSPIGMHGSAAPGYAFFAAGTPLIVGGPTDRVSDDLDSLFDAGPFTTNIPLPPPRTFVYPTSTSEPLDDLSWLKNILNDQGIIKLPKGEYKLGKDKTFSDVVPCPKTPFGSAGRCTLLHACPKVLPSLTTLDVYMDYFCEPNQGYAGVCCPEPEEP